MANGETYHFVMCLRLSLVTVFSILQTACASNRIIRDQEYDASLNAYRRGEINEALKKFPSGENGGLITSVEKSWLALWDRNWDPKPLQTQVDTFDSRKYTSLSREAGYFLMQEAEEGYAPSEHEVVILHLLSATHFLQLGNSEEAQVELRRAGYILDRYWDDPGLRLWLGSLWASVGQWPEAQVDFRRAQAMSPNPQLARLAEGPPVPHLWLEFFGVGPIMNWKDGRYTPEFSEVHPPPEKTLAYASTLPWFQRHSLRNTDLRDTLVKSNFMAQYLGGKAVTGTEYGVSYATTAAIKTMAVALGVAVVGAVLYIGVLTGNVPSGEELGFLFSAGFGTSAYVWNAGDQLGTHMDRSISESDKSKGEALKIYRLARYLPGWVAINIQSPAIASTGRAVDLRKIGVTEVTLVNHF